jgi:LPS export ABC transporter protein LptC
MNINLFFISILAGLIAIFLFFKPLHLKEQKFTELPLFELKEFSLHELNTTALTIYMSGKSALRYSDRYEVKKFHFIDSSKKYLANIQADYGIYKDSNISLYGNIKFVQKDGLTFQTQSATYNKKTNLLRAKGSYTLLKDTDRFQGKDLYYYNKQNRVTSKDITAIYQIQENF